jgi:hypothetical protein
MTKIDLNNGVLYLNGQFFQPKIETEASNFHTIDGNSYSNFSMNGIINNLPFNATGYYKNKTLRSIILILDSEYLKENYRQIKDIDFRDYISPYLDFWKGLTEKMLSELMKSNKRSFIWGNVKIQTDPRNPTVYSEIKYHSPL